MMGWRLRDLAVEGMRNVGGAWAQTVLLLLASASVVGGFVVSEFRTSEQLLAYHARFVESGGNVFVVHSERGLPADRCVAASQIPGVIETAGVESADPAETGQSPGTLFNTGTITAQGLIFFAPGHVHRVADVVDRWIVGGSAAQELGVVPGMWLNVTGGDLHQIGVTLETQTRNPRIQRWIMTIKPPTGNVDECWIEFAAGVAVARQETLQAMFADIEDVTVGPWIRLDEFSRDPIGELTGRPQAWAWVVGGSLLGAMGWMITWFRRSQIGLYRAVGTSASALLILGVVELAAPLTAGALIGTLWAAAGWAAANGEWFDAGQLAIAIRAAASTTFLALVVAPLLWPIAARGMIASQLKVR